MQNPFAMPHCKVFYAPGNNGANGKLPQAALMQANDGNFYGTTGGGGTGDLGTVFKVTPSGILTTLISFNGNCLGSA